jgi:hypothetical protein
LLCRDDDVELALAHEFLQLARQLLLLLPAHGSTAIASSSVMPLGKNFLILRYSAFRY